MAFFKDPDGNVLALASRSPTPDTLLDWPDTSPKLCRHPIAFSETVARICCTLLKSAGLTRW